MSAERGNLLACRPRLRAGLGLVGLELVGLGLAGTTLAALGCGSSEAPHDAGLDAAEDAVVHDDASADDAGPRAPFAIPECDVAADPALGPLRPRCQLLVDDEGRVVLLRGVNARVEGLFDVSFDDGRAALEPIPDFTDADATRMRELGLNFLRLPVSWSALEPTDESPRAFDETYLARLDAILAICRAHGIHVLVDFHQDAYSKEIGEDGAPLWAIAPAPSELLGGPLDDLGARRSSPQVLAAFDTFFGDAEPGPMLRGRFAEAVVHVAEALRGDTTVVGLEIYNEPVSTDAEARRLNEAVAAAVRRADPARLVFFEPPALPRNVTNRAMLATSPFAVNGAVYAPHSYTLAFVGTEAQRRSFTRETLRESHANAVREAASWGTPLVIGEWGYDPAGTRADEYYALEVDLMDEHAESWALWVWKEQSQGSWGVHAYDATTDTWSEREVVVRAITRPRPERIAGWPRHFGFDAARGVLEVRYRGESDVVSPTLVYLPLAASSFAVSCDGTAIEGLARDASTGLVAIPCAGPGEHTVLVTGLDGL